MHHSEYLVDVLIFLAAAVMVVPAFRRFRSSPILGYLVAGIVIGPYGLALIGDTDAAHTLAEFGVVFLLFMIGLELSIERLRALRNLVFGLGTLQVTITGFIIGAFLWLLGFGIEAAAIIGGGLALSSTAFVLQSLVERGERATPYGLTSFAILLFQDLAVVPFLIFITLLGNAESSFVDAFGSAAMRGAGALIMMMCFGRFLLKPLFRIIASTRSSELFVSTTLLVVLGTGWLMAEAGLSMELGAFLAGLLLAETEYRHQVEADIRPFRGILLGLFFITIGMSIDIFFIFSHFGFIALLVVGLLTAKTIITTVLCRIIGIPLPTAIRTGTALAQGGEFGFVLFGLALSLNLLPTNLTQILLAIITLSVVATPVMFYLGKRIVTFLENRVTDLPNISDENSEIQTNHVLIAGFGRVGQTVAKVLSDAGISYVALDLDQNRVTKCRAKGMPVYYGNADQIQVLEAVGAARATSAVITLDQKGVVSRTVAALRGNYPDLPIFARARDRQHVQHLEKVGATEGVSEAAEASLQLGSIVLTSFNVSTDEIASVVQEYREDDYALLDEIVD